MMKQHSFMDRPIPDMSALRTSKSSYRDYPIRIDESAGSEFCVAVNREFWCESYYWHYKPRPEGAMEEIFLREGLVARLKKIDRQLQCLGLRMLFQEGFRPIPVQYFVQKISVLKGLRKEYPTLSGIELREMVKMFASSVNGNMDTSPYPHSTGGALDLSLVDAETHERVDMGKWGGLYHTAFPDALETLGPEFEKARRFRRLLFWLACEQGIATNPTEWWHLCYGDQMWAWITQAPHAVYGTARSFRWPAGP